MVSDSFRYPLFFDLSFDGSVVSPGVLINRGRRIAGGKLAEVLKEFVNGSHGWLRIENDTLLFRHWDYAELRAGEIPECRWERVEQLAREGRLTPDHLRWLFTPELSEAQVYRLESVPTSFVNWRLHGVRAVRFLMSLSPAQLNMAQKAGLPVASLTGRQRQLLFKMTGKPFEIFTSGGNSVRIYLSRMKVDEDPELRGYRGFEQDLILASNGERRVFTIWISVPKNI